MLRISTLNLDFVLILQGGLLLLLATASFSRSRRDQSQAWIGLGWYALLQAFRTGLDLAVYENSTLPLFTLLGAAIQLGSSLILLEFAHFQFPRISARSVQLFLLGGITASVLLNGGTVPIGVAFTLATLGGVTAAATLWRAGSANGIAIPNHPLRLAALVLLACQIVTALPDQHLEETVFALPPIALRCALFFILTFAVNGRDAVNRLIKEKFDVVLMDNYMPIMDGFNATKLIRDPATQATDPAVYIVALTANASTDDRAKCLAHA